MQVSLHAVRCGSRHPVAEQIPSTHGAPAGQAYPHSPQFRGSVLISAHVPAQQSSVMEREYPAQLFSHPPQLNVLTERFSQPESHDVSPYRTLQ